jgi:hypothetical protein
MFENLKSAGYEIHFESHALAILQRDFPSAAGEIERVLADFQIPITEIIGSGGGETKGTRRLRKALNTQGWVKTNFEIRKSIRFVEANAEGDPVQIERESTTHEIDHVKAFEGDFVGSKLIALEIEWNNKDPFFDRDLENFKRLHTEGAISAGIIITRGTGLQEGMWDLVYRYATEQDIRSFEDLARLGVGITPKQRLGIESRTARAKNPVEFREAWVDKFVGDKYGEATTHWNKLISRINRGVGNPCPLELVAKMVRPQDRDLCLRQVDC